MGKLCIWLTGLCCECACLLQVRHAALWALLRDLKTTAEGLSRVRGGLSMECLLLGMLQRHTIPVAGMDASKQST